MERLDDRSLVDSVSLSIMLIGGSLAVSTVAYFIEQRKGGQVFDMRPDAGRRAYRSPDIAFGYVQVILADGTVRVEVKEPKGMFGQVLDSLALIVRESAGVGAKDLANRAALELGDIVTVHTQIS